MIVTSSWFTKLPEDHLRIGISRGTPRGMAAGYRKYPKLNPGPWFRSCSTPEEYRQRYYEEILNPLDPEKVVTEIEKIADGKVAVLACYEPPTPGTQWCHRALVSLWLKDTLGLDVPELGLEEHGCGHHHPKLHPILVPPKQPALL